MDIPFDHPAYWSLDDIADRDAMTELIDDPADLPLGMIGTKYDHARRRVRDYHLDTDSLALGDRHLLIAEVRRLRRAILNAYNAMDAACRWAANETAGVKTVEDADRHVKGYDALLDATVLAGLHSGELRELPR